MSYATVSATTAPQLALQRSENHWSKLYLATYKPATIYTARLASLPSSKDRVAEIAFNTGSGTLGNVVAGMTMYVGTSAGAYDLGTVRIRKAPIAGTFYIGEESEINWQASCYLTVVADFELWARHIRTVSDTVFYADYDITYTDQNNVFNPMPIMGGHRVVRKTGSTVNTFWDFSNSYVIGSTISSYSVSAPTSSAISGGSTATPTITFDTMGWHVVYLTVTAANSKTSVGVRYVYVYGTGAMPAAALQLNNCEVDYDTGGWMYDVNVYAGMALADVPERALCILFSEDSYGGTQGSIGQLAGCENIICVGRIAEENYTISAELPEATLRIQGMHFWMQKTYAFPTGIVLTAGTPANWAEMHDPTVAKVAYYLAYWASTLSMITDVYLPTGDTRIATRLGSVAANLWSQLQEISFATIYARPGVDRYGRLFVETEPQMTPVADRTWATVMTLTDSDWSGLINMQRIIVTPTGVVDASGVVIQSSGTGTAIFARAPGHVFKRHGNVDVLDRLLLTNQALTNQMAGLMLGWRNNPYPNTEVTLAGNYRMIDCFPRQKIAWTVPSSKSIRGFSISGNFIPRRVSFEWDSESGVLQTRLTIELEGVEELSINGDIPGDGNADLGTPPSPPSYPPIPDIPVVVVPWDIGGDDFPPKWLFHDTNAGLIYTTNFNDGAPDYFTMNSGLTVGYSPWIDWIGVCPNGAVYVAGVHDSPNFIARASGLGQPFVMMTLPATHRVRCIAVNPTLPEQIGFLTVANPGTTNGEFHIGTYLSYNTTVFPNVGNDYIGPKALSHGQGHGAGEWIATKNNQYTRINSAGTVVASNTNVPHGFDTAPNHLRAGDTGTVFLEGGGSNHFMMSTGNMADATEQSTGQTVTIVGSSSGFYYWSTDCSVTGQFLMGAALGSKGKSSDYGATWVGIPTLPPGNYVCGYGGMNGTLPRFVMARGVIRASPDWGVNWVTKEDASLLAIAPFPNINIVKCYGLGTYGNP